VKQKSVRVVSGEDILQLFALPVLTLASWLTPTNLWGGLTYALSCLPALLRFAHVEAILLNIKSVVGKQPSGVNTAFLRIGILADMLEHRLQILRDHFPGGWRPRIRLVGQKHIEQALNRGHGAILWVCPFDGGLVTKMALHRAGFAVSHLSLFSHGYSATKFGMRVLNPIRVSIENRYLQERIIIPPDGSLGYARKLEQRLRSNGLISINLAGTGAQRIVQVPFQHGVIRVAAGPASLALATKASLLPIFALRKGSNAYDVIIKPPLQLTKIPSGYDPVEYLASQYVISLESYIVRYPALWRSWHNLPYTLNDPRKTEPRSDRCPNRETL
jgi:lauroyl/myristoyl acyltransferase